jgi:hypothetical protein
MAIGVALAGWLVPGLGHLLLGRWKKALAYLVAVTMLAVAGLLMRGNVFNSHGADAFDMLGYFADLGNGIYYFMAHSINAAGPDVSRAAGDYGTRLFATSGVLNMLCVLEGIQISLSQKRADHVARQA